MPTQTFPCPFCGKKMGVGIELLGKKVRCPHCNQILVAPAPTNAPLPPPPVVMPAVVPPPPPPPAPIPGLPTFNLPTREARESIFDEREDESDDVFGSSAANKPRVPEMPLSIPSPPPQPSPLPSPVAIEPSPAPIPEYPATIEMNSPFGDLATLPPASVPPPVTVQPVVVTAPPSSKLVPTVAPIGATPPSSAGGNPWAGMDELPPAPVAVPAAVPTLVPVPTPMTEPDSPFSTVEAPSKKNRRDEPESDDRPAKRSLASAPASGGKPLFRIAFFILAPYALIVTIAAIYGLFLKSSLPAGHPLSNLPDNFGEFAPAERKKTGRLNTSLDGELPADQKVALGSKLDIGQLAITALGVEERKLKLVTEGKSGAKSTETTYPTAIVLKLRVTNTSDDLLIHPLDPAFNRQVINSSDKVGTVLMVGKASYPGGAIPWPFKENVTRKYDEA